MRSISRLALASFLCAMALGRAPGLAASEDAAVMKTIATFIDAANKGNTKGMETAFAPQATIVDDFPPHRWTGSKAIDAWAADFEKMMKTQGVTDPVMVVSAAKHLVVSGKHAFAPVPGVYTYKIKGKTMNETGVLVFALDRLPDGWKIVSMSWGPIS